MRPERIRKRQRTSNENHSMYLQDLESTKRKLRDRKETRKAKRAPQE